MKNKYLFEYVKDHLSYFGFFPYDYEDIQTGINIKYPDYMKLFNKKQTTELNNIFDNHEEYKT